MQNKIKMFENKQVRTLWNADEEEWYFSVVDIVSVLTDNDYQAARNYWKVLRLVQSIPDVVCSYYWRVNGVLRCVGFTR